MSNRQFPDCLIRDTLKPYGVSLTPQVTDSVRSYAEALVFWNQRIDLTSLREPAEILQILFGESIFAANLVEFSDGRLADVGAGAGFPGLAVKLFRPKLTVCLLESNAKKAAFLAEVVRRLGLHDVEVYRGRMEHYPIGRSCFDFITARAVGRFRELLQWSKSALSERGRVILWLGLEALEAIKLDTEWQWGKPSLIPNSRSRFILVGLRAPRHECST